VMTSSKASEPESFSVAGAGTTAGGCRRHFVSAWTRYAVNVREWR
jgi:hypothetical protein